MSVWKIIVAVLVFVILALAAIIIFTDKLDKVIVSLIPRPQEPKDRPYIIREVTFPGGAKEVKLAGELTMPHGDGPFPAIIMITGSGPQNRNEELAGHKPFLVFSDYMTRQGYAVLRYDDRGVGQSSGQFREATTKDFAADAASAMRWLRTQDNINIDLIGYAGHSEGGYIAPLAAQEEVPGFIILLAGPAQKLSDVILQQQIDIAKAHNKDEAEFKKIHVVIGGLVRILKSSSTPEEARKKLQAFLKKNDLSREQIDATIDLFATKWGLWIIDRDLMPSIKAYKGPVLAVFGGKDLQVSAEINAPIIEKALSHKASQVVTFPELNHLFQPAKTGSPEEYVWIETTFDESALKVIADWLKGVIARGR